MGHWPNTPPLWCSLTQSCQSPGSKDWTSLCRSPGHLVWKHNPVLWSGSPRRCVVRAVGQCMWWAASCFGLAQIHCTPGKSWWCWGFHHSRSPPPTRQCLNEDGALGCKMGRKQRNSQLESKMINGFTKTRHKLNFLHHSFPIFSHPLPPFFIVFFSALTFSAAQGHPFITIRVTHLKHTHTPDHCDQLVARLNFKEITRF